MSCSTIAEPAEPAITDESQRRGRGRPKGTGIPRIHTCKLDIDTGIAAFTDLACRTNNKWAWDGTSYPKTKRSQGPNVDSLVVHSEPLKILLQLAPNGYPDPYRLRDLLMKMHFKFNIFEKCKGEAHLNLSNRAIIAADRWRIQCRHLVMLKKCGQDYGSQVIKELLAMISVGSVPAELAEAPAPAELVAVPAPAEPAEMPPPPAEATSQYWRQPVPYTADGVINWGEVEDQLPELIGTDDFECEVKSLDFKSEGINTQRKRDRAGTDSTEVMHGARGPPSPRPLRGDTREWPWMRHTITIQPLGVSAPIEVDVDENATIGQLLSRLRGKLAPEQYKAWHTRGRLVLLGSEPTNPFKLNEEYYRFMSSGPVQRALRTGAALVFQLVMSTEGPTDTGGYRR